MKIVATSDTHFPFAASKIPDGDVFIHAGDLMYDGTPQEWEPRVESLANLPHKAKIYVPGNHDYFPFHYRGIARSQLRREANVTMVDDYDPWVLINGIRILCLPFVTGLPGWAYNHDEQQLLQWLRSATDAHKPQVVVSHAPPYKILDAVGKHNYGCLAYNQWFHGCTEKPKVWICGHIHDSYGHVRVEGTDFYNVSMCNENYDQTNSPIVIEV